MTSTFDRLIRLLRDNFARADTTAITADSVLAGLNMDSLDRLEFAVLLDEEFQLDVEDQVLDEMLYKSRTVGDLVKKIEEVLK